MHSLLPSLLNQAQNPLNKELCERTFYAPNDMMVRCTPMLVFGDFLGKILDDIAPEPESEVEPEVVPGPESVPEPEVDVDELGELNLCQVGYSHDPYDFMPEHFRNMHK